MGYSIAPLPQPITRTRPKRRKQFVRPEQPPTVEVTDRDLDMLEEVARHRFLNSRQIAALVPGTPEKVAKRCGKLFAAGLLDQPRMQLDFYVPGGGSKPHVFAISNTGASLLVEHHRANDIDDLDWSKKNKKAGRLFIQHTLAVADFSISLTRAEAMRDDHKLLHHDHLVATLPAGTQTRDKPWAWGPATLPPHYGVGRNAATFTNVPDHAFRIDLPGGTRRAFLVEIDRATMPVARKNLYQTSILKKLLGYHFGHRLKLHKSLFDWSGLRFLIVTTTPARVSNILKVIKSNPDLYRDTRGEHFWVTCWPALNATPDIFTHPWQCADGTTKTIAVTR